jgi:hypothetical protein
MAPQDTTPAKPSPTQRTPIDETLAARSTPERFERFADDATGINVPDRKPIDARMPSLPPA